MIPVSPERQIRNDIYRACDAERERQISKGYDAAHDDGHGDGEIASLAAAVAMGRASIAYPLLQSAALHIINKHQGYHARITIAHAMLTADLERLARAAGQPQPRIEVARLDPDVLVGIAPCDDGSPGWVVLAVKSDGTSDMIEPLGDGYDAIVYTDILDAAEVLRTGIVWKHDMGEESTDDPDSGPLDVDLSPLPVEQWRIEYDPVRDEQDLRIVQGSIDPDSGPLNMEPAPILERVRDEHGRIEYTATYRLRQTGEVRVTTLWAQPDSTRERLISLLRRALAHAAAKQGVKLGTHEIATLIDPDSYVFDPPATDVGASPGPAT